LPPVFCASATTCNARVVLPELSGPYISTILPLGKPPIPRATSKPSEPVDIALGIGGLPRGRIVEIYGPESSGKTTLALHVVAEAQKTGGTCAFVDAEHALDPVYAKN
jgi:predicted ATP-dependent serine protease